MEIKTVWISSLHYHLAIDQIKQQLFIIMEKKICITKQPTAAAAHRHYSVGLKFWWIIYGKISNLRVARFFSVHSKSSFECLEFRCV